MPYHIYFDLQLDRTTTHVMKFCFRVDDLVASLHMYSIAFRYMRLWFVRIDIDVKYDTCTPIIVHFITIKSCRENENECFSFLDTRTTCDLQCVPGYVRS